MWRCPKKIVQENLHYPFHLKKKEKKKRKTVRVLDVSKKLSFSFLLKVVFSTTTGKWKLNMLCMEMFVFTHKENWNLERSCEQNKLFSFCFRRVLLPKFSVINLNSWLHYICVFIYFAHMYIWVLCSWNNEHPYNLCFWVFLIDQCIYLR